MKKNIRIISLLLALSMLFCFAGCNKKPSSNTQATTASTTPVTTPEPTEPPVDWATVYKNALEKLDQNSSLTLKVSENTVTTIAGKDFPSGASYTAKYQGLGTEDLIGRIDGTNTSGNYEYDLDVTYAEGFLYFTVDETKFCSPLESDVFMEGFFPPALLSADNYGEITGIEANGSTIHFNAPIAPEGWLPQEDITINTATGIAKLDATGNLLSTQCTVSYEYGSASITSTVTVEVQTGEVTVNAPMDTEIYHQVEDASAIWLVESAYGFMDYADTYSATILNATTSQAAGIVLSRQIQLDSFTGNEYMSKVDTSIHLIEYAQGGKETDHEMEETFIDGKYSAKENDGRPSSNASVTKEIMMNAMGNMLVENLFLVSDIETAKGYDLGSVILLEFTANAEAGEYMRDSVSTEIFGQTGLLEELASKYETTKYNMYLSVDKYTGLPIAFGFEFTGTHTIQKHPYELTYQHYQEMDLASMTAYKEISDELELETEPENQATPLFYHVTGAQGQEMWLLGTIHVGDERTGFMPQEIYDAFAASDALALECDTEAFDEAVEEDEELQDQISEHYFYSDGSTAKDHITTEDLYEDAVRMLKATGNYNYNTEMLKVNLWANSISNFYLKQGHVLSSDKGVEGRLTKLAHEQEKPIREVESTLFQIGMLTGYSDNLQEFMLYSDMSTDAIEYWENVEELYALWCAGDEAALIEEINNSDAWEISEDDFVLGDLTEEELLEINDILVRKDEINAELAKIQEEYNSSMESNRNAAMLEVAKEYLESGDVVFFAVGLAHLLADDGLVNTLRDAGYTVELVQYTK